ncbi:MAG: prephenate dehydrogenase/arogenate dehydrogenase family protein [Gammaproteobacteria bacterium]|nr:MAG: prephenate dehydrogenase/arogenate dehydrogenase family protein [Gammaproteobacteria bacterium]
MINKICICGVGLIGGSFALALKKAGFDGEIIGFGRTTENLQKAVDLSVIDRFSCDIKTAVSDADLIMLATPMLIMPIILKQIKPFLSHKPIITDVGSVKEYLIQQVTDILGDYNNFVGAHPIAGKEKSGVEAVSCELFIDKKLIITPLPNTNQNAIDELTKLWLKTGAKLQTLSPAQHDKIFSHISHLPHMLAYSLINTLHDIELDDNIFAYAAGGFSDFSRIGASDPQMWADICLTNKNNIADSLQEYISHCQRLKQLILTEDHYKIMELFSQAQQLRQNL